MKTVILVLLSIFLSGNLQAQYDFYLETLLKIPSITPDSLPGEFIRKQRVTGLGFYYEFSNASFPICYYPPVASQDCGYFELFSRQYQVKGKYQEWEGYGCELDGETLRAYQLKVRDRNYVILTSIAESNGKGTRNVFCQLFNVDQKDITHYPLWSIYGSKLSFGDYNDDGKLDFLETRYEQNAKDDNTFRVTLKTLSGDKRNFEAVNGKYIIFHQEYTEGLPKISVIEKHW